MVARIESALVVRDPGNARSAEAYEGLRRTVVAAGRDRRRHLAHLVAFAEAVDAGVAADDLRRMIEQWCTEEGLERSSDATQTQFFRVLDSGEGEIEVTTPAWVDTAVEGPPALVRQGQATRGSTSSVAKEVE
jgi:hypothetical protein